VDLGTFPADSTQVAVYVHLNPVVAVLLEEWLLDEPRSVIFGLSFAAVVAGAATVALISTNAAGTGDCGRRWSQSGWLWPPTWSQFGRSPAPRQRSATRSQGR
jgi:hypothetical protein